MTKYVDVIIPTYNRGQYIERSIRSVLNQSYQYVKVYVIDDNSSDDTKKIVQEINDERVFYFKNSNNMGANYCRNKGVEISKSPYIAFNDSDDEWLPEKIEIQLKTIGQDEAMVFSPYYLIDNGDISIVGNYNGKCNEEFYSKLLEGNIVGTPTILLSRKLFEKSGGFNPQMKRFQDWEFCLRLAQIGKIKYCPSVLVNAYRLSDCITKSSRLAYEALKTIASMHKNSIVHKNKMKEWIYLCMDCNLSLDKIKEVMNILIESESEREKAYLEALIDVYNNRNKVSTYLCVANHFLINSGKIMNFFKENEINDVCIYGNSMFGQALGRFLINAGISVSCFIDNNVDKYCYVNLIQPSEYDVCRFASHIINTVPSLEKDVCGMFSEACVVTLAELMEL